MQLLLVIVGAGPGDGQLPCHRLVVMVKFALLQRCLPGVDSDQLSSVGVSAGAGHDGIWVHCARVVHSLGEVLTAGAEDK